MHRRTTIAAIMIVGALAFAASSAGAQAPLTTVQCGQTLIRSVTLANDLTNCPGNGLVIGAGDITVNLNGHTIDGITEPTVHCDGPINTTGIADPNDFDGITIENGVVEHFDTGIGGGFGHSQMTGLTVRAYGFGGIGVGSMNPQSDLNGDTIEHDTFDGAFCGGAVSLTSSNDSAIEYNRVTNLPGDGVDLVFGDSNRVEYNSFSGLGGTGVVLVFNADGNQVDQNVIVGAGSGVAIVGPGSDNQLEGNAIERTTGTGILVESASFAPGAPTDNRIAGNTLASVADGIILFEAQGAVVSGNSVSGAGTIGDPGAASFGVLLDGASDSLVEGNSVFGGRGPAIQVGATPAENPSTLTPTGDVVSRNAVSSRGADGIEVVAIAHDTTVEGNTANRSGADGIHVLSATTTLSANAANRNGNLGIEAVFGVIDGGDNTASGNGNAAQCVDVLCTMAP
jgi:large repetitive protein